MLLRNEYLLSSFMKECCSTSYTLVYSYSILKGTRAHSPSVFVSIKNALAVIHFWSNHHLGIFILFSYFINEKNHVGYVMHVILRIYVDIILYLYNLQQANIYSLKIKVHEIIHTWMIVLCFIPSFNSRRCVTYVYKILSWKHLCTLCPGLETSNFIFMTFGFVRIVFRIKLIVFWLKTLSDIIGVLLS